MPKNPSMNDGGVDPDGGVHGDVVVDDVVGEERPQGLGVVLSEGIAELPDDPFGVL
jgi:hypothetical protein